MILQHILQMPLIQTILHSSQLFQQMHNANFPNISLSNEKKSQILISPLFLFHSNHHVSNSCKTCLGKLHQGVLGQFATIPWFGSCGSCLTLNASYFPGLEWPLGTFQGEYNFDFPQCNALCASACNHSKSTKIERKILLLAQFSTKLNKFLIKFWDYLDTKSIVSHMNILFF